MVEHDYYTNHKNKILNFKEIFNNIMTIFIINKYKIEIKIRIKLNQNFKISHSKCKI